MAGRRPEQRVVAPIATQTWRHMTFLHWPIERELLAGRLPDALVPDVDEQGRAWLGVTLFLVGGFNPALLRRRFPETNVRTYVRHRRTGRDGIWFLSLLADHRGLVAAGRAIGAPYQLARLRVSPAGTGDSVAYRNEDRGASGAFAYDVTATPGETVTDRDRTALDDFVTGRWRAFTTRGGVVAAVPVEHEPWPLRRCRVEASVGPLLEASGVPSTVAGAAPVAHYAREVNARLGLPWLPRAMAARPGRRVTATA